MTNLEGLGGRYDGAHILAGGGGQDKQRASRRGRAAPVATTRGGQKIYDAFELEIDWGWLYSPKKKHRGLPTARFFYSSCSWTRISARSMP